MAGEMMKPRPKHAYVTLIDLPEAMPFGIESTKEDASLAQIDAAQKKLQESDVKLFAFVNILQKKLGEQLVYIGEDIIGEKFYKRFLFEKGGFVEIMTGVPVAISAHFIGIKRANKFAEALKHAIQKTVSDPKPAEIMVNTLVVNEEEAYKLTYEKWDKMRQIREGD